MREIKNPKVIVAKGLLFLVTGIAAAALLLLETPTLRSGLLLGVAIWAFCRFYYFAFYVISQYVDASYRYSGLLSLAGYLLRTRKGPLRSSSKRKEQG
jgi:hypothetical protein